MKDYMGELVKEIDDDQHRKSIMDIIRHGSKKKSKEMLNFIGTDIYFLPKEYITVENSIKACEQFLSNMQYVPKNIQETDEFKQWFIEKTTTAESSPNRHEKILMQRQFRSLLEEGYITSDSLKLWIEMQ